MRPAPLLGLHDEHVRHARGVACPTASACVAVDTNGDIQINTNPFGGGSWTTISNGPPLAAIACATTSACIGVGGSGTILTNTNTFGGGSWASAPEHHRAGLSSVTCPTATACVAVGVRARS